MEYYENIKFYRKEQGLTQAELAEKLQVSRQTVVRWENGLNVPSLFYAQKLANCFQITVSQLMNGKEDENSSTEIVNAKKSDLFASTLWICVLSFFPYILFVALDLTIESIRQLSKQITQSPSALYRVVTDPLDVAQRLVCIAFCLLLLAWWIAKFIGATKDEDKYSRYRLFNQWRVGLAFVLTTFLVVIFESFSLIELPFVLTYIGGLSVSVPLVGAVGILIKKINRNWMLGENNGPYRKLNKIYFIIFTAFVGLLTAVILFLLISTLLSTRWVGVLFEVAFLLLGGILVVFLIGLSYFIARAIVYFSQKSEENKEE